MKMKWLLPICLAVFLMIPGVASAEEPAQQFNQRIAAEWIAKYSLPCDAECVSKRLDAAPYLKDFAREFGLAESVMAQIDIAYCYEWGYRFERLFGRPPSAYDWGVMDNYHSRRDAVRSIFRALR